ncbi:MAG TPA: hypothetical protein VM243_17455 [Phycisphaerae bacterium]|nr:hypothetical protein [Phycisphaerae bacterium]
MSVAPDNPEAVLRSANRRLAELLHAEPLDLATGGGRSMRDRLWVWGVLGGKEVGKSTLVNALAGAEVVDCHREVGEGTFQPAAYLAEPDLEALKERFGALADSTGPLAESESPLTRFPVTYHPNAPQSMRGLVLVDLPDFDSLFEHHVERVRRISSVLDGIIWITTPKKVGDLRAMAEIQRVLKARCNFVYVVNKIDWLLAQAGPSDGGPEAELQRVADALASQIAEADPDAVEGRAFLISARYRSAASMLDAIARSRGLPDATESTDADRSIAAAVDRALGEFDRLRQRLITAPTAEEAEAGKRANLTHQVRVQARDLLSHFRIRVILERLNRVAGPGKIDKLVARFLPPAYCERLLRRLNPEKALFAEWSSVLFQTRIARWPLLGIIAWPMALFGSLLGGLRGWLGGSSTAGGHASFDFDGLTLEDRVDGVLTAVQAQLAGVRQLDLELPSTSDLSRQFRIETVTLAEEHRSALIEPLLQKRPGPVGRLVRWIVPVSLLIWFPLAQPVLAGLLPVIHGDRGSVLVLLTLLVGTLSAGAVLTGLAVSLLLFACLVAAVYSRAVRDTHALMRHQRESAAEIGAEPLTASLAGSIARPIEQIQSQLAELAGTLECLADGRPDA